MPREMSDWRTPSSVCAICSGVSLLAGVKLTSCAPPVGSGVVSDTAVPEASPFTRLAKFASPPAKSTSCGARRCTSSTGDTWISGASVCICTAWESAFVLRASAAARRSDLMAVTSEEGPAAGTCR